MKINVFFTRFMMMTVLALFSLSTYAQSLDIKKVMLGTLKEIKVNSITILNDADSSVKRIDVNSNTEYDNVQKWTDLRAGDKVQIEYQEDHNQKVATTVTKLDVES